MVFPEAVMIPKERIPSLHFPKQPVELTEAQRNANMAVMRDATRLGNTDHGKCRIVFEDDEGLKAVETTIWTFDKDHIVLKYGTVIPIGRVVGIHIP